MITEERIAFVTARAAELNARVAGMVAENQLRQQRGESIAYGEAEFSAMLDDYQFGYNDLIKFFEQ